MKLALNETAISSVWLVLSLALGNVVCCESRAPERQILGLICLPVGFQSLPGAGHQARQASREREDTFAECRAHTAITGAPGRAPNTHMARQT